MQLESPAVSFALILASMWWFVAGAAVLLVVTPTASAAASEQRFALHVEAGAVWQARNDVQIPNDDQGTRFSLEDVAGSGPWATLRVEGLWSIGDRHQLRALYAPLSFSESGFLETDTRFADSVFDADEPVDVRYQFDSWRVGYRYRAVTRERWNLWVGGTLKVRDAEIRLSQDGVRDSDEDVGFVPLLHLAGEYRFDDQWSVAADMDALAGGPGRAVDLGVRLEYRVDDRWRVGLGYRTLEGVADTDDVYNFSWFNAAVLSATMSF